MEKRGRFRNLPEAAVTAGAAVDRLAQPFRRHHRLDYRLDAAHTDADLVWSKALPRGVADVYPPVSPGCVVPRERPQGTLWACGYADAINRAAGDIVSVYVNTYHLAEFLDRVVPLVDRKLVLIVGDSDHAVPDDALAGVDGGLDFLDGQRIVALFAQNLAKPHPRALPFPIGLDFHAVHLGYMTWGMPAGQEPQSQEDDLLRLSRTATDWSERACQVLVRVNVTSNPLERSACVEILRKLSACRFEPDAIPREALWQAMSQCRFVASPPGNGLDCHRTWEALVLGAVPIVRRVPAMSPLFSDLPVWEVDGYDEVTDEALAAKSAMFGERIARGDYDMDKLKIGWWRDHIRETVARLAALPPEH